MASDREAVEAIVTHHRFQDDVAYGHTKLFVRTPRSLFSLEQERAALIPILVLFLQKVSHTSINITILLYISDVIVVALRIQLHGFKCKMSDLYSCF